MNGVYLKQLVESKGAQRTVKILSNALHEGELSPKEFHIRELWESFVGPVGQTLAHAQRSGGVITVAEAAVDTTAFANITGEVLMNRAMAAYDRPGFVGDALFDTVQSSQRQERIPGFTLQDETAEVDEAQPYPEAGIHDKFVDVESGKKRGLILKLTEEAIYFDETGQLLRVAAQIGRFVRLNKEKRQLNVITDNGPASSYQPAGVETDIYSSGNGNLLANNALEDWSDINTAMQTLAAQTDENDEIILVQPRVMFGPLALRADMLRIVRAMEVREVTNSDTTTNSPNPVPEILGGVPSVITSPLFDDLDDGDEWYMGEPTEGFVYRQHWPFQSFRIRSGSNVQEEFTRDVVEQYKFREWGTPACVDHRFVLKNAVT